MPKVILLICTLGLALPSVSNSQQPMDPPPYSGDIPQQSAYLELGGNGIIYSFNYDVLFQNDWGFRLGGSYYPLEDDNGNTNIQTNTFTGLVMGYRSLGKNAHKLEVGGGVVFGIFDDQSDFDVPRPPGATASIGYRYYPPEHSYVTFKVAFTPMMNSAGFHPRIGISVGITLTPEGDAEWP